MGLTHRIEVIDLTWDSELTVMSDSDESANIEIIDLTMELDPVEIIDLTMDCEREVITLDSDPEITYPYDDDDDNDQ